MNGCHKASKFEIAWVFAKYSSRRKKNGKWLGALWSLLEPLLLFFILLSLRGLLSGNSIPYYPVYLFLGLTGFHFYTQGTRRLMVALTSCAGYIKTFPLSPEVYIYSAFFEMLADYSYQLLIVMGLLIWFSLPIIYIIPFLFLFLLLSIFTFGIGVVLAGVDVYFRDIEIIWGLINRVLFFATPVFYVFNPKMWFCKINPLTWYLHSFRMVLIEQRLDWPLFLSLMLCSVLTFIVGLTFFSCLKLKVAETI